MFVNLVYKTDPATEYRFIYYIIRVITSLRFTVSTRGDFNQHLEKCYESKKKIIDE